MPDDQPGRPSLLANLILMLFVGIGLFAFIAFTKGCAKSGGTPEIVKNDPNKETPAKTENPATPKPSAEDIAKSVAQANELRPRVPNTAPDPNQSKEIKKLLLDTSPRKPFTTPPDVDNQPAQPKGVPAKNPSGSADDATPAPEPVREVAANSPEGAAVVNDAIARIDEAPSDLYSDKAKAKVREGLKSARRIFKVDTVYFEKGGASPVSRDKEHLAKALQNTALQEASNDPRAVFFVLGFADKTGNADTNKKLSRDRADAVINLLRKEGGVLNLTYPVAVGSTEIVSPANKEKNRAAEVWLVLP